MAKKSIPTGVTLIARLCYVATVLILLFGVMLAFEIVESKARLFKGLQTPFYYVVVHVPLLVASAGIFFILGDILPTAAAMMLALKTARGLQQRKRWARNTMLAIAALFGISSLIGIAQGYVFTNVLLFALSLLCIHYLLDCKADKFFSQQY
jgi:hypothetical protein